jgi:hypothetical protein
MSDLWIWVPPLILYAASFWHHAAAWRHGERIADIEDRQQKRMEMLREAIALAKYGARQEAEELINEAVELGEVKT